MVVWTRRLNDCVFFFFQAEDGIRDLTVTGVQTCALPISGGVSTSDLWGKCQEQFIQQPLCKKVPQQLWTTLDQDEVALARSAHRLHDRLEIGRASCRERV